MTRFPSVAALVAAFTAPAMLGLGACSPLVGDACETSTDCGTAMYCETSLPSGYCTRRSCERDGCPEVGVCVVFEPSVSYCMASCASDADCRDGYRCVTDFGPHAFCGDARGETP